MTDNKFNFTFDRLNHLTHDGSNKRLLFHDTTQKGLVLCITPSGNKSFQIHHWDKIRRRSVIMTLGRFPLLTFTEARKKARRLINQIEDGVDVKEQSRLAKEIDTFADVFEDWLQKHAMPHKKSWKEDQRRYDLYMKNKLGKKPLSWFTTDRVRKWHHDITKIPKQRGGEAISIDNTGKKVKKFNYVTGATANRALALLSTIFNQMRPNSPNPCKGVKKFPEKSRSRFLQPDELKRFLNALDAPETPEIIRDYVYLSLLTGGRRSNVLSMKWGEIDLTNKLWCIPASKSKNNEEMLVPLSEEATDILERRKKATSSVFVFASNESKTGHLVEPRRPWTDLLKRAEISDLRIHDLRRTMGSYQTITGASTTIVGRTLGHKSPEATAVYARLNLDPVRASLDKATAVMLAMKDTTDKIMNIDKNHDM